MRSSHPTLHAVVHKFATEAQSLEHLRQTRWPEGPVCANCKTSTVRKINSKSSGDRTLYRCLSCKKQFSATSSIFLKGIRHVSEWLIAAYLVESNPAGITARQLQRLLGMSYLTAARLRRALRSKERMRKLLCELCIGYVSDSRRAQKKVTS